MFTAHFFKLLACLSLIAPFSTYSMESQFIPASKVPLKLQNQALQLVLLNCLQRHDFEGVSHIIEHEMIEPGVTFIQMLKDKVSTPNFKSKETDYCYEIFKHTQKARHWNVTAFLKKNALLMRIYFFAQIHRDLTTAAQVLTRPDFPQIVKEHNRSIAPKNLNP